MLNNKKTKVIIVVLFNFVLLLSWFYLGSATNVQSTTVSSTRRYDSIEFRISLTSSEITAVTFMEFQKTSSAFFGDLLDWGVDDIEAERVFGGFEDATDIGGDYNGSGITIAILDSGIDKQSGSLHDEFTSKIVDEYDFYNNDGNAEDNYGHGTHCAGIASARDNDNGIIGTAPESDLLIGKVGDLIDSTVYFVPDPVLAQAINWAVDKGADIISMSFGFYTKFDPVVYEAIADAYDAGVVLVAASGNDDREIATPANISQVIAVGAISKDHLLAGYPDYGWVSGKASNAGSELDVVAPGTAIYSSFLNNNFGNLSGTSMAAPHVAGLCALILQAQPYLSPTQVKEVLRITATDLGPDGRDDEYGFGEVQAVKAVDAAELYFTDSDSDGLTDTYEKYCYYTNPLDSDSDNDGLNDGDEVNSYLTDPNDADCDDDGLNDEQELNIYNTNPWDSDTDNDGCPDGWEVQYGYNPLVANGALDLDDDNLRNMDEYYWGTNPNNADTDGDLMNDWDELYWGLNPLNANDASPDYDDDGLTNLEEVNGWYDENSNGIYEFNEKDWYQTNPNDSDTDNDNWSDYVEQHPHRLNPSDPTDPDSNPGGGLG